MFVFRFYLKEYRKTTRKEKWKFLYWELGVLVSILADFDKLCHHEQVTLSLCASLFSFIKCMLRLISDSRPGRREYVLYYLKKLTRVLCLGKTHWIMKSPNLFPSLKNFWFYDFMKSINLETNDLVFNFCLAILKFCELDKSLFLSGPYYIYV